MAKPDGVVSPSCDPDRLNQDSSQTTPPFGHPSGGGESPVGNAPERFIEPAKGLAELPATRGQGSQLFESFDPAKLIHLRDRALISTMAFSLARVSAVTSLRALDFIDLGRTQYIRLHEKGGVERDIPAHPSLVEHLDAWLAASGVTVSHVLFPAFEKRGTVMTTRPMDRNDVLRMVKRRLRSAGIPPRLLKPLLQGDWHHRVSGQRRRPRDRSSAGQSRGQQDD